LLLERALPMARRHLEREAGRHRCPVPIVETVVKLGGGLLAHKDHLDGALEMIATAGCGRRLLVVPGGGLFADVIRDVDRRLHLSDDAAHWMAVLAMDQYAHLIAARIRRGLVVAESHGIVAALEARRLPVLAPSRWLREADPLPHTWDVTSDSIAAWAAGALGAQQLVLIKPPGVKAAGLRPADHGEPHGFLPERTVVDRYFLRALSPSIQATIVAADDMSALQSALRG
jgi:aspartokinase-like uncharacterized kinase